MLRNFSILWVLLLGLSCTSTNTKYSGHGADSLDPETLEKFAPKPLDSGLVRKIQNYLDIRTPSMGVLSSDGKSLYINWKVTGTYQVWKLNGPKSFPIQLTGGEDSTMLRGVAPNGKFILLNRDSKGDEYPGLYMQSSDGGPLIEIFKKDKVQVIPSYISLDSNFVYYRANDIDPSSYNIYKYNVKTKKRELIFGGKKGYWVMAGYKKGKVLLGLWKGNTASEFWLLDEKTKKLSPIIGQNESEEYEVDFGHGKNEYIVLTNKLGEFRRLYRLHDSKLKPISPIMKNDVSSFSVDYQRKKILYETNIQGHYDVAALSAKTFKPLKLPKFKVPNQMHTYFGSTTKNGRYTMIGVETSKAPRTTYVYDWQRRKLTKWTYASSPEVDTNNFSTPSLEYYTARDGTKIPMFVTRPKSCEKKSCPVVVNFHGGPEAQAKPFFSPYVQLFVDEGFVFVQPNVRGSDGYGKTWLHSDNGPKRLDVITDIQDAATYIRKNWSYDNKVPKIAVMGGSYGGYSTFVGMTLFSGTYDAGIAVVGMSSLITFLENTASYRRQLRVTEYGDPDKDREALIKLSPMYHLDKIQDPILIVHGATDPRVPAGEAIQVYQAMKKRDLSGELILFADEGHGVRKRKNKVLYIGHALKFLNKHLRN